MRKQQAANYIVQVVLGIIFAGHGIMKFQNGLGGVAGWFASMGLPGALAYIVAIAEVAGGVMLIVGLGVRYVAALFAIIMAGAIIKVKLSAGLFGNGKAAGFEFELALLAMNAYLAVAGVKGFLDNLIGKNKETEYTKAM
ncbi:DoxX family protein [Ectobacillus panaciterrae]|uniref:DoxX family protein n=1 Tax=Ectobacillus panaciterrae TaxID=363872 RepID=UPI0004010947|nr:DoxX family protein [Ectobacillus panaciterrae]